MDLDRLGREIRRVGSSEGPYGLLDTSVFRELASRTYIRRVLQGLQSDDELADAVGRSSYHHPNGFEKIVLWRDRAAEFAVVLHVWWPVEAAGFEERRGNVHDHRWDFSSCVVAGVLDLEEFRLDAETGDAMYEFRYGSPGQATAYSFEHVGSTAVVRTFGGSVTADTRYWLHHRVLHRAWGNVSNTTITLVVQFPVQQSHTRVLRPSLEHPIGDVALARLDGAALRSTTARMLEHI